TSAKDQRADQSHHANLERNARHHGRHRPAPRSFLWHERSVLAESTEPLRPAARPGEGRKIDQGTSHAKTARARPRMKGRTPLTGASSGGLVPLSISSQLAESPQHSLLFLLDPLLLQ